MVEGPKDAAALLALGLLACGLNTCRLAAKFARLFSGVEVVLIPDRDRAGEEGSQFSARVLRGVAKLARIAVLPAEFKESGGDDVRDVLRRPDGCAQVLQAISDAAVPEGREPEGGGPSVKVEVPLPEGDPLKLEVKPVGGTSQRVVVAIRGDVEHRDRINTDSSTSRERFIKKLAKKVGIAEETLAPLVEKHLTKLATECDAKVQTPAELCDEDTQSQATLAANMAVDWVLWHTPSKDAYATIIVNDHQENWLIRSQTFNRFVARQFYHQQGKAMSAEALSAAVNLLEAKALFEGEEHSVHVRVAEHGSNIYLDLCNATWQVVEITPLGWCVIDHSPVRFRRSRGMLPLPAPEPGGKVDLLREFLNVEDVTWCLIVAWLVASLCPRGPYPLLALFGEHGSGKSTAGRLLRACVDPNSAPLRAEPKDGRDLMISANNSWCLAFDNLSYIPPWLSDALCRLSTGGGFATRELYTDQDEIIFDLQRPVLLTSIEEVATRSDLLDRCLIIWLKAIATERRRAERELLAEFEKVRPLVLGALLDAVSVALRRLPSIKIPGLPRLADFALWATAAESALGWTDGTFMKAYERNRESANDLAIEASVVAGPLLEFLESRGEWSGRSSELLTLLEQRVTEQVKREKAWPKNGRSLSGRLKRLAPNLRALGWLVDYDRTAKKRSLIIRRAPESAAPAASSPASPPVACEPMQSDADLFRESPDDEDDADDAVSGRNWNPDRY